MSTIHETVDQVLAPYRGQIPHEANGIVVQLIGTLEQRERRIAEQLRDYAYERGLSNVDISHLFDEVGLDVHVPLAVVGPNSSAERAKRMVAEIEDMRQMLDEMRAKLHRQTGV